MTLQTQFLTMGMMFGCGLALGVVFDACRVLTGQLRAPRWLIPLLDLLFWAAATVFVFKALFYSNQGQVRLFVFIGLLAGVTFHYCFTSRATIRLVLLLILAVKWLVRFLIRTVDVLIVTPILALYKFVLILLGFLSALSIFLYKIMLQLLYPFWRIIRFFGRLLAGWIGLSRWGAAVLNGIQLPFRKIWTWIRSGLRWLRK